MTWHSSDDSDYEYHRNTRSPDFQEPMIGAPRIEGHSFGKAQPEASMPSLSVIVETVLGRLGLSQKQDRDAWSAQLAELDLRILRLEQLGQRLERNQTDLVGSFRKLEGRVNTLLAARTRDRADLATNSHNTHQTIALAYRALVEQRVQAFARAEFRHSRHNDRWHERQRLPRFIAELSKHLFYGNGGRIPLVPELRTALGLSRDSDTGNESLRTLRSECLTLGKRTETAGLHAYWDFTCSSDAALDSERQEPWSPCDPNDPVRFVVAPAYVVEGQVYARQYVYTSPGGPLA
ncbi:hypothetical protein [Streptomyces erythrochromogenes]|uniref:hypothetical protein n=1 Tax=Streptomyces erythrochromogenes TaxID=285574 RepID=UPI00386E0731|nr:hypothetical protein OG364_19045 [Streptomyces erythrochromogenes]